MNSRLVQPPPGTHRSLQSAATARLQLTSLVDMMVILVVFLLMSFSVEGQLVTPADDLELPASTAKTQVQPGMTIEIGLESIRVDGRDVASAAELAGAEVVAIEGLDAALAAVVDQYDSPEITIHCDRRVDFHLLGRILRACGREGLEDVSLLVLEATS